MKLSFRRFLSALLCAALCFALAGCGSRAEAPRSYRIGVFMYKGNDTFISNICDSLSTIAGGYKADNEQVYLSFFDAAESQTTQKDQLERCISLGYDALCVNLVDRTDAASVIDMAREASIPIVFFNREPVAEDMLKWDRIVYVGTDARETAEKEAQIVVDAYRADPASIDRNGDGVVQYIMLEGESRHQDALIRTEVSVEYLKSNGLALERLDGGIANWNRNQAAALCEKYFAAYGDGIELILCNNDDMALGAADIVARQGLDFHNIVGIDGTPQGLAAVQSGQMLGTVVVDYAQQAQLIFDLALGLIKGTDLSTIAAVQPGKTVRAKIYIMTQSGAQMS